MYRLILFLLFVMICITGTAQPNFSAPPPKVDERVELLSIVFRLAGNDEYNNEHFKTYVNSIHSHFDRYKNHPLIPFTRQIAERNGIGFDAVMFMAIHLSQPPALQPLMPLGNNVPEARWPQKDAEEFVRLLQQFYRDADAASFFKRHAALYATAEQRFSNTLKSVDFRWFPDYYGRLPESSFHLVIGIGNGGMNFGPRVQYPGGREDLYAVVGTWDIDSTGYPVYPEGPYLPTIIHEYNHSFINPLVEQHRTLEESGKKVFETVKLQMQQQAYDNWKTMIDESLVRASVIRYLKTSSRDSTLISNSIRNERRRGFLWMDELVELLEDYESNRAVYQTLNSFMPRVQQFYSSLGGRILDMKQKFDAKRPRVIAIEPFSNHAQDVDTTVKEILIHFDKALDPLHMSFKYLQGANSPDIAEKPTYTNNNRSIRLKVRLKPGTSYGFVLGDENFYTPEGDHLMPYTVRFTTKK